MREGLVGDLNQDGPLHGDSRDAQGPAQDGRHEVQDRTA